MDFFEKNIRDIAADTVEKNGFFLIDMVLRGNDKNRVIEIFIDGEKNVSAEDCAKVSRDMNSVIEGQNIIESNYRLDVSSPGTDRPLIFLKQYPKHINRKFDISYNQNKEIKELTGKLTDVSGDELTFLSNNKQILIIFNDIINAKVIASFS